jgi:class 3 adenylate cyclase
MALEINASVREHAARWHRLGFDLALGTGIAQGYATLGRIGYEGRYDYAAIGSVTNQAARLCAEAEPWQVLVPERLVATCDGRLRTRQVGTRRLKGFARPVEVHDVLAHIERAG